MRGEAVGWARGLIVIYLLGVGLVYTLGIGLWGNPDGLRALHVDIPISASDTAFQRKALVNFIAGVIMLMGCTGLAFRRRWGTLVAVIGLVWQVMIYLVELVTFQYLPTLGATAVVLLLDIAIVYHLARRIRADQPVLDKDI